MSPSFRISKDNLAGFCTVEFEIVILRPELDIVEFERSGEVSSVDNIGSGSNC